MIDNSVTLKSAFFYGIAFAMMVSGIALAPKDTQSGDKYMWWTVTGIIIVAILEINRWRSKRRTAQQGHDNNLKELLTKK